MLKPVDTGCRYGLGIPPDGLGIETDSSNTLHIALRAISSLRFPILRHPLHIQSRDSVHKSTQLLGVVPHVLSHAVRNNVATELFDSDETLRNDMITCLFRSLSHFQWAIIVNCWRCANLSNAQKQPQTTKGRSLQRGLQFRHSIRGKRVSL